MSKRHFYIAVQNKFNAWATIYCGTSLPKMSKAYAYLEYHLGKYCYKLKLEVIQILGEPTVSEFADFLNISQSNATYKVNNLIKKGYLERANSQVDRREYHLILSEKYYSYLRMFTNYEQKVVERMKERFSPEDAQKLDEMFQIISNELMPECDEK